jgi:hypothetical protein
MFFSFLADLVEASHVAFLVFTLIGQIVIFIGIALKWQWVRNPWFRCLHLACIVFVAFEYIVGMECPLTDLEVYLRDLAGETRNADASFIGRLMHRSVFIFEGVDTSHWGFLVGYVSFALLVLATFYFAPPRFRRAPQTSSNNPAPVRDTPPDATTSSNGATKSAAARLPTDT